MVTLTEDEVDDLIYFARAGEAGDLGEALAALAAKSGAHALDVLVSAVDEGKNTALHMAAGNGHTDVVQLVLDQTQDAARADRLRMLDATNAYDNTALHWAAMNGHLAVVRLLVEVGGASPALANDKNYVPLDLAGLNDKTAVVDYFLASAEKEEREEEAAAAAAAGGTSATGQQGASSAAEAGLSAAAGAIDLDEEDGEEEVVFRATRDS